MVIGDAKSNSLISIKRLTLQQKAKVSLSTGPAFVCSQGENSSPVSVLTLISACFL